MAVRVQFGWAATRWTEWRVRRIADPVERLRYLRHRTQPASTKPLPNRIARRSLLLLPAPAFLLLTRAAGPSESAPAAVTPSTRRPAPESPARVWQVESTAAYETYSNGLRVENRFATSNRPRSYVVYPVDEAHGSTAAPRSEPAGIVFHTTESPQAPFEPDQNQRLRLIGESLLEFVRSRRAYNFVVDRFGRVFRIVMETDAAHHAGHSVWADDHWLYAGLNDSFLGISFETRTEPGQSEPALSPAQLHAGATLVEMLRKRYAIPAENCVTHAQVSVNPANMRVGYHTDWASAFPFAGMQLPDNYALPLPAVWAFGFEYDLAFLHTAGSRMYAGVGLAEERVRRAAAQAQTSVDAYRKSLRSRYAAKAAAPDTGAHSGE